MPEKKPPPKPLQHHMTLSDLVAEGNTEARDPRDDKIAALEASLEREANRHYEERFVWILVLIVLFDALIFSSMVNWAGALVIGLIELIGVVILADRCKVDTVAPLIDRLTGFVNRATNHGRAPGEDD